MNKTFLLQILLKDGFGRNLRLEDWGEESGLQPGGGHGGVLWKLLGQLDHLPPTVRQPGQ